MRKLLILPIVAVIASVTYFGAVRGEEIVEVSQEPAVEQLKVVEPVVASEVQEQVAPAPIKQNVVSVEEEVEPEEPIIPYWRTYLVEQKNLSAAHAEAVDCILGWGNYLTPASALAMHPIGDFMQSSETYRGSKVIEIFEYTLQNRPCFG